MSAVQGLARSKDYCKPTIFSLTTISQPSPSDRAPKLFEQYLDLFSLRRAMDKLQTSTMPAAESDSQKLQRLGFVQTYSEAALSKGYEVAGSVYNTTRGYVPAAIEDKVSWGEDKVSEISTQYGAPLVNTVQDKSQQILGIVDSQVRALGADVVVTAP